MRSPDAALVSWPRWNALSEKQQESFPPICPEFVIELRSPSDRLAPLQEKMYEWIANGTELAWLVDPSRKAVEIYRPGREVEVLEGASAVEGEGPVAGFVLELGKVWG
jgi:Uma2 family endonuclease